MPEKYFLPALAGGKYTGLYLLLVMLLLLAGCAAQQLPGRQEIEPTVSRLGYSIQAGAFSRQENAERLVARLRGGKHPAYSFRDQQSGLYKVRLGNYSTYKEALQSARHLVAGHVLEEFYIVVPEGAKGLGKQAVLRRQIIGTARQYLGIPYKWGGTSATKGFDCSGLAMVSYRLHGLNLPRTVRQQYASGRQVARGALEPADLVFFATNGKGAPSHVGIYLGKGEFIHAPRAGAVITTARLSNSYFRTTFLGGRRYF